MSKEQRVEPGGIWSKLRRWSIRLLVAAAVSVLLGVIVVASILYYFNQGLPPLDTLANYKPPEVSRMYDRQGRVVAELFKERRTVVDFKKIPQNVRNAFLAAEDADFYHHRGLDFTGLLRAFWANLKAGRVVQGGSTITQQVIKTFLLGPERSYSRKIRELLLAFKLESNLTKDEIIFLYLNQIYFGHSCYGVQEASRYYFAKDVSELSLAEGATLASLPKSPARYSPIRHPERAKTRRDWVVNQMLKNKMIDSTQAEQAHSAPVEVASPPPRFHDLAPYYAEYVRRKLVKELGRDKLYQGGLRVDLALDLDRQRDAQKAVRDGLRKVDQRQGYRGPLGRISETRLSELHGQLDGSLVGKVWSLAKSSAQVQAQDAWTAKAVEPDPVFRVRVPVVSLTGKGDKATAEVDLGSSRVELTLSQLKWARKFSPVIKSAQPKSVGQVLRVGDVVELELEQRPDGGYDSRLSQPPLVQGALVAIDPVTRHVLAMVGGSDFRTTPLIRAVQSARQPGSAFKPVVYATAVQEGLVGPASIVMDTPETYRASLHGRAWKPKNYERVFRGPVSLRYALAHSINTVAVKMAADVGPGAVVRMAKSLGVKSRLQRNLSISLGSSEVTPLELTNVYATFASGGMVDEPRFIVKILTGDGQELPLPVSEPQRVLSPAVAYVITSLLRSVVEEGTARKALKIKRPLVGKTGTANQQRDGWFVGYSPELVCGVWVGFDDHARMGHGWAAGSGTALPIWVSFMGAALAGLPRTDFATPDSVIFTRIDPENGLLAPSDLPGARFEVFVEGSEPKEFSNRMTDGQEQVLREDGSRPLYTPNGRLPEGLFR